MARSYRKPVIKDGYKSNWKPKIKQQANSTVRLQEDLPDGNAYKKVFNSWDICDFKFELPMPEGKSKTAKRIRAKSMRK
jgi:hypothetical protein